MHVVKKLETDIEQQFVDHARNIGYLSLKFEVKSRRNHPDQQVFIGWGCSFFIEFKREGKEPRRAQISRIKKWRGKGYSVYVCDTLACAVEALNSEIEELERVMSAL